MIFVFFMVSEKKDYKIAIFRKKRNSYKGWITGYLTKIILHPCFQFRDVRGPECSGPWIPDLKGFFRYWNAFLFLFYLNLMNLSIKSSFGSQLWIEKWFNIFVLFQVLTKPILIFVLFTVRNLRNLLDECFNKIEINLIG